MRPPVDTILAPQVPRTLRRIQPARPIPDSASRAQVVCFWDLFQPASLRALDYLVAWQARHGANGLRVLAVHAPSIDVGRNEDLIAAAARVLDLPFEVALDTDFELWRAYENPGWPARYVLAPGLRLVDVHFGEGGYAEAEATIIELLGSGAPAGEPLRVADRDDALVVIPTADVAGPYSGAYAAGEVWVVVAAPGTVEVDGRPLALTRAGAHRVVAHERHTEATIAIRAVDADILRTAFAPGLAPVQ